MGQSRTGNVKEQKTERARDKQKAKTGTDRDRERQREEGEGGKKIKQQMPLVKAMKLKRK